MIIKCKNCSQRYNFNEILLNSNGSKVKYIKCGNIFVAYPSSGSSQKDETDLKSVDRFDAQSDIYVLPSNNEATHFPC